MAAEIKLIRKNIDHAHRIVFTDPVNQPLRKQSVLAAVDPLNETLHNKTLAGTMTGFYQTSRFSTAWTPSGHRAMHSTACPQRMKCRLRSVPFGEPAR